jgi:hypothetical protein
MAEKVVKWKWVRIWKETRGLYKNTETYTCYTLYFVLLVICDELTVERVIK